MDICVISDENIYEIDNLVLKKCCCQIVNPTTWKIIARKLL